MLKLTMFEVNSISFAFDRREIDDRYVDFGGRRRRRLAVVSAFRQTKERTERPQRAVAPAGERREANVDVFQLPRSTPSQAPRIS